MKRIGIIIATAAVIGMTGCSKTTQPGPVRAGMSWSNHGPFASVSVDLANLPAAAENQVAGDDIPSDHEAGVLPVPPARISGVTEFNNEQITYGMSVCPHKMQ